jgi:lipid A 3-O-deacylase
MRKTYTREKWTGAFSIICAVMALTGVSSFAADLKSYEPYTPPPGYEPVEAFELNTPFPAFERTKPFPWLDEVRLGVLAANLEGGGGEQAHVLINGELLFGRPDRAYEDPILNFFLRPRPHVGFSVSPEGGTNQVYAGVTWDFKLTDKFFAEATFGGTLHDGPTGGNDPNSLGCSLLFRESAGIGYAINERLRIMLTVDHMSNASLCDQNQGLTNAGVRLGYKW